MISPSEARELIAQKSTGKPYYTVGVEVPPRHGSVFSMRYTTVPSARAGWRLLRRKMQGKRVGMVGELFIASGDSNHTISLGGFIRRPNRVLFPFDGQTTVGKLRTALSHRNFRQAAKIRAGE